MTTAPSYRTHEGLTNRANSALLRIDAISKDTSLAPATRLALIAEVMADEPILTDSSAAAITAREDAARANERLRERARLEYELRRAARNAELADAGIFSPDDF